MSDDDHDGGLPSWWGKAQKGRKRRRGEEERLKTVQRARDGSGVGDDEEC
eukprot:gene10457-62129_t